MNNTTLNSTTIIPANLTNLPQALMIKTKSSEKAISIRRQVAIGLIKPADEKYLTGEPKDREKIVASVVYAFPEIQQTAEAWIDANGNLFFNTENVALATKDAVIKIICLVCTHLECIKSSVTVHLHPLKGYIRAKDAQKIDMQFGDEIEPLHISNLYTLGDSPSSTNEKNEKNNNQDEKKEL